MVKMILKTLLKIILALILIAVLAVIVIVVSYNRNPEIYIRWIAEKLTENEIDRLFVLPEFQGKGYGRALLDFAEERIAASYDVIILHASLPAKSIYLKRGFREVDYLKIDTGYGDFLCADVMEKKAK